MKTFKFKGKVWVYPGIGGWHFVNLPKELSKKIKSNSKHYANGLIKIKAFVGKSSWDTALFPHKESQTYLISINKKIRKKEEIFEDDMVTVKIEVNAKKKNINS